MSVCNASAGIFSGALKVSRGNRAAASYDALIYKQRDAYNEKKIKTKKPPPRIDRPFVTLGV